MEIKRLKLKKEKDAEIMKLKISMLREQLNANLKILSSNEESINTLKTQEKNIDTKLIKLQHIKKTQQELLQKILASTSNVATSSAISEGQNISTISSLQSATEAKTIAEPKDEAKPPLITSSSNSTGEKLNLLQLKSILTEKINKEKLELSRSNNNRNSSSDESETQEEIPSQPPLPQSSPPPLPPIEQRSSPPSLAKPMPSVMTSKSTKSSCDTSPVQKKLPPQMTLGGVVAATVTASSSLSASNSISKRNISKVTHAEITRPNLYISKQTNTKLERLAKEEQNESESPNKKSRVEYKINTNENVIINSKVVVNTHKNSSKTCNNNSNLSKTSGTARLSASKNDSSMKKIVADQDLKNRQKLNDCLDSLLNVNFSIAQCESFDLWSYETLMPTNLKDVKQIDMKPKEKANNTDKSTNECKKSYMLTSDNYFEIDHNDSMGISIFIFVQKKHFITPQNKSLLAWLKLQTSVHFLSGYISTNERQLIIRTKFNKSWSKKSLLSN